ncbi:hypothetical protein PILCRDRAFT_828352 [Piloderma croceum F 1598]|uniref:Ubiquitin-like domain-containing protein n=1 Tax=Piloderma croceum (strain F 1598) TaxID=765440 RepID=A0A0C3BAK1_PILCF|nr:hypothetical protein PILCRDRAFT_828352 [Piloderma croceum F 1598]
MDSSYSNIDARQSNFSHVGRDQNHIHVQKTYNINNTTYHQTVYFSLFGSPQADRHVPISLSNHLPRLISSPETLPPRSLVACRSSDAVFVVDNTTGLIDQITRFLLDRNHSSNDRRDLALELESLHQTLTLIKLTIQKYNDTPLGQSLANLITPEVNGCSAALQALLDSTEDIRLCLSSTSISHLWRQVWRPMLRDKFTLLLRKKLSYSRQLFQELLVTLHSVALTELGTELHAGLATLQRFHGFNHQILPSLYHIKLNTVDVLNHLGEIIPVPTIFCSTWKDFHYIVQVHCRNRVGIDFIERGDYEVICAENSQIVRPSELAHTVQPGMKLEMSILLRPEIAFQDAKETCPRCHHINLNATVDLGWIQCRKCSGLFQIAGANQNRRDNESIAGHTDKRRGGIVDEYKEGNSAQNGDEEIVSPASQRNETDPGELSTTGKRPEREKHDTQFFRRIRVICMNDDPAWSIGLSPNLIEINDVLEHLLDGPQHVVNVDDRMERARESFNKIELWHKAQSAPANIAVMKAARTVSRDYAEAIELGVKAASHGIAFVSDIINLCEHLSQNPDGGVSLFFAETRMTVQLAHTDAKSSYEQFRAIRQKLLQIIRGALVQQKQMKIGSDNRQRSTKEQDYTGALMLLHKASDDMSELVNCVSKFTNWWSKAETMISTLEKQMPIDVRRMSTTRVDVVRKNWAIVEKEIEEYRRNLDALNDFYFADKKHTPATKIKKLKAVFMRNSTGHTR